MIMVDRIQPTDGLVPAYHIVPSNKSGKERKKEDDESADGRKKKKPGPEPDEGHQVDRRA